MAVSSPTPTTGSLTTLQQLGAKKDTHDTFQELRGWRGMHDSVIKTSPPPPLPRPPPPPPTTTITTDSVGQTVHIWRPETVEVNRVAIILLLLPL